MSAEVEVQALAFSGDGGALWVASADGRVEVWTTEAPAYPLDAPRRAGEEPLLDLASDGEQVLGVTGTRLLVWDRSLALRAQHELEGGVHRIVVTEKAVFVAGDDRVGRLARGPRAELRAPAWWAVGPGATSDFDVHAKGTRLVVVKDGVHVHVYDAKTGEPLHRWTRKGKTIGSVSVRYGAHRDRLWEADNRGWNLRLVSAKSGRQVGKQKRWENRLQSSWAGPLASSADRTHLAVLQTGRDTQVWDLGRSRPSYYAEPVVDRARPTFEKLTQVTRFAQIAPGIIKRKSSRRQPDVDADVVAIALALGGERVALGGRDGSLWCFDTRSCAIDRLGSGPLVAAPRCSDATHHDAPIELGTRGVVPWMLRGDVLGPIRLPASGEHQGIELEGLPPRNEHVAQGRTLYFRDDVVWRRGPRSLHAWDITTGRLEHTQPVPGLIAIVGAEAFAITDASIRTTNEDGRFELLRFDLERRAFAPPLEVSVPRALLHMPPSNWPQLVEAGGHLLLRILSGGLTRLFLFDPETGSLGAEVRRELLWSHSEGGRWAACTPALGRLSIVDLDAPETVRTADLPDGVGLLDAVTYFAAHDLVAAFHTQTARVVLMTGDGELLHSLAGHSHRVAALVLSEDAQTLVAFEHRGRSRTWNLGPL